MGLTQGQKKLVKAWVASGKTDKEIIALANNQDPPFKISRQNISKNYRRKTEQQVQQIISKREETEDVLRAGLALKEERIKLLAETAEYLTGAIKKVPYDKVSGMVNAMRGCLDDIAKELGQRSNKIDVNANVRVRDIVAIVEKVYGDD